MIPMTTQHLGSKPGRARLGACGPRTAIHAVDGCWSREWHVFALTSAAARTTVATMPYVGGNPAGNQGFDSIKRPARHLGTRST